ncbi:MULTISPECIES: hypothetical protein [Cytobacillus]|nr:MULTISPECIES: hypothetical protein [Cytobacillus]MDK7667400.1 hypothetical protein [Cytobacillus oceanisediminis]MEC1157702.1 hypothetical protein [Cytobacillus horneckiae]
MRRKLNTSSGGSAAIHEVGFWNAFAGTDEPISFSCVAGNSKEEAVL